MAGILFRICSKSNSEYSGPDPEFLRAKFENTASSSKLIRPGMFAAQSTPDCPE